MRLPGDTHLRPVHASWTDERDPHLWTCRLLSERPQTTSIKKSRAAPRRENPLRASRSKTQKQPKRGFCTSRNGSLRSINALLSLNKEQDDGVDPFGDIARIEMAHPAPEQGEYLQVVSPVKSEPFHVFTPTHLNQVVL
ncbi:hypothetical protein AOLI_G00146440 [Acnodon oligacanthus]